VAFDEKLKMCIDSIFIQDKDKLGRIIVVQNGIGSSPPEPSWLHSEIIDVVYSPLGLARARNQGLRVATSALVAFVDSDVTLGANWLTGVLETFDKNDCTAAGGEIRAVWEEEKPEWIDAVMLASLSQQLCQSGLVVCQEGEYLVGANMVFKRDQLLDVKGFPESLGRYGSALLSNEEQVPQDKIRAQGGKIVLTSSFHVCAPVDVTRLTNKWFVRRFAWQAVSDALVAAGEPRGISEFPLADTRSFLTGPSLNFLRSSLKTILEVGEVPHHMLLGSPRSGPLNFGRHQIRERSSQTAKIRVVDTSFGGHSYLAYKYAEILGAEVSIANLNPWGGEAQKIQDWLVGEFNEALRFTQQILFTTLDPVSSNQGMWNIFQELSKDVEVIGILHRIENGRLVQSSSAAGRGIIGTYTPRKEGVIDYSDGWRMEQLVHPIMRPHLKSSNRARAKSRLQVDPGTIVVSALGDLRSHKNFETLILSIESVSDRNQVSFLLAGACTQGQKELIRKLSGAGQILDFTEVVENSSSYRVLNESEISLYFEATDVAWLGFGPQPDFFSSSFLDFAAVGSTMIGVRGTSTGNLIEEHGVGILVDRPSQNLAQEALDYVVRNLGFVVDDGCFDRVRTTFSDEVVRVQIENLWTGVQ
jgi:hypothetical protein